jgi:hypothetical protein
MFCEAVPPGALLVASTNEKVRGSPGVKEIPGDARHRLNFSVLVKVFARLTG